MEIKLDINKFLDFGIGFLTATALYLSTLSQSFSGSITESGQTVNETTSYSGFILDLWPELTFPAIFILIALILVRLGIWYRDK